VGFKKSVKLFIPQGLYILKSLFGSSFHFCSLIKRNLKLFMKINISITNLFPTKIGNSDSFVGSRQQG
jgi:hypothetical protein